MNKNEIHSGKLMQEKIMTGVNKVSDAVGSTLGPSGLNVVIEKEFMIPHVTKDGVTVAKSIVLEDRVENIGAQLIREASEKTNKDAGDGTTTATVLAQSMINSGAKFIGSGANGVHLRNGLMKLSDAVVEQIDAMGVEIGDDKEMLKNVAMVSSNNDAEIADTVCEAIEKIGKDGIIEIEGSPTLKTKFEVHDGYQIEKGWVSGYFVTDINRMECVFENPAVLICNDSVMSFEPYIPLLKDVLQKGRPFVVVADKFSNEFIHKAIQAKLEQSLPICLIQAPALASDKKEILDDLALIMGTQVCNKDTTEMSQLRAEHLGSVSKIVVKELETTFFQNEGVNQSIIVDRVNLLKTRLEDSNSAFEKKNLKKRIAKLMDGVGVIYVGAVTEGELKEKKDRFDDAVSAIRASLDEGIVSGGGTALLNVDIAKLASEVELSGDEVLALKILETALQAPFRKIVGNCGRTDADVIINKMKENNTKWDARAETYLPMTDNSVIDPKKVTKKAFQNAVSVAGTILTMNSAVTIVEDKEDTRRMNGMA